MGKQAENGFDCTKIKNIKKWKLYVLRQFLPETDKLFNPDLIWMGGKFEWWSQESTFIFQFAVELQLKWTNAIDFYFRIC